MRGDQVCIAAWRPLSDKYHAKQMTRAKQSSVCFAGSQIAADFSIGENHEIIPTLICAKFAACMILVVGVSVSASASCADSLSAMAVKTTAITGQHSESEQDSQSYARHPGNSSIVGLWHVEFKVNGQTIQEAYQLWNAGGTEVHNPNVDPRGGTVCLGVWTQAAGTYTLAHRVWNYDTNGNFLGSIHLSETLTLGKSGNTHSGSFTSAFYDPTGHFINKVTGNVTGRRISVP